MHELQEEADVIFADALRKDDEERDSDVDDAGGLDEDAADLAEAAAVGTKTDAKAAHDIIAQKVGKKAAGLTVTTDALTQLHVPVLDGDDGAVDKFKVPFIDVTDEARAIDAVLNSDLAIAADEPPLPPPLEHPGGPENVKDAADAPAPRPRLSAEDVEPFMVQWVDSMLPFAHAASFYQQRERHVAEDKVVSLVECTAPSDSGDDVFETCLKWIHWDDAASFQGREVTLTTSNKLVSSRKYSNFSVEFESGGMKFVIANTGSRVRRLVGPRATTIDPCAKWVHDFVDTVNDGDPDEPLEPPPGSKCAVCSRSDDAGKGVHNVITSCALCNLPKHLYCELACIEFANASAGSVLEYVKPFVLTSDVHSGEDLFNDARNFGPLHAEAAVHSICRWCAHTFRVDSL
jgi:hypothetical protein